MINSTAETEMCCKLKTICQSLIISQYLFIFSAFALLAFFLTTTA